MLMLKMVEF